ncbi:hypothetical protein V6N13_132079 [Hibiscus sabdariffa]
MGEDKGTVYVTGGTGFVASWLIKVLLHEGYSVHTTVRADPGNKRDLSFLTSLPGADEKFKIFTADLDHPESYAAIRGCKGVFHVAAPVDFPAKDPEPVVTQRAVNGSLGILKSCLRSKTVKRVVYTSSITAVYNNIHNKDVEMMDESYWSDVDYIRKTLEPSRSSYAVSKTLTEKAMSEFAAQHGLDLVTVVPPMVLGNREDYHFLINAAMVHVDDLSRALIFLLEHPEAKGSSVGEAKGPKLPGLWSKKLTDLGFKFKYGVKEMYDGAIQSCKEKGFLD